MENPLGKNEKLDIKLRLATVSDAELCRDLRVEAVSGSDHLNFGNTNQSSLEKIGKEGKRNWVEELSQQGKFTVLLSVDGKIAGIGRARDESDSWYLYAGYVKPEFRGGSGKKVFACRLREIQKRGGTKVSMGVKDFNFTPIAVAEFFGFKKKDKEKPEEEGLFMELENVNDESVQQKISQI